ncbi:MAG: hypothetical protein WKF75_18785 [Singulisphaera sp.]
MSRHLDPALPRLYLERENFYFGFIDVPTTIRDVTTVYNDFGFGYFLYRALSPTTS